ncbi:hypothetical protein P154DRAFT_518727 [Amniculicola lignicola CBS 123094]|uniref:INO80 complex subunit B-like conserved region domain-containing protein n=1 Tax=Amniculicola lignicola CBS 123094 TaxID=1392246 RepID=A0A6A5WU18_9PLEO|nr:hypothetical protein P154DRAFT_518727 [Amniculicola lignicola CBS 123094]
MPQLRSRAALTAPSVAPTASSTRPRRGTANQPPPAAVIERSSPEETRQSIHLTVKADPSKLRKATGGVAKTAVTPRNIVAGKRASRSSRIIREIDSDEEEDDDDEPEPMDVDDEEEDEEDEEEDDDQDAEGEDDDEMDAEGEEDDEMDDIVPAPRLVVQSSENLKSKPSVKATAAQGAVEAKEILMADDDDDEELSELESEEEGDDEDAEGEDEDAEGEEEETILVQNGEEDDDEDLDSEEETPQSMSRSHTPDLSKMTRRQRAIALEDDDGALMALSNEAQKKKHLTAEEHAMRRAEMARRRKNLSEKRNEEEKMDTINRLLKKQPPKRGRRVIQDLGSEDEGEVERANPLYVRYKQTAAGSVLAVPQEWLQAPVGSVFTGTLTPASGRPFSGRMVEEVS